MYNNYVNFCKTCRHFDILVYKQGAHEVSKVCCYCQSNTSGQIPLYDVVRGYLINSFPKNNMYSNNRKKIERLIKYYIKTDRIDAKPAQVLLNKLNEVATKPSTASSKTPVKRELDKTRSTGKVKGRINMLSTCMQHVNTLPIQS